MDLRSTTHVNAAIRSKEFLPIAMADWVAGGLDRQSAHRWTGGRRKGRHCALRGPSAFRVAVVLMVAAAVGVPLGARAEEYSQEVVIGGARVDITCQGRGQSSRRHGILAGIASVANGRVSLADHVQSLTVVERSPAGSPAGGDALPWEEAEPLLARVLANHDSLDSVPASGEVDVLGPVGQRMYLPRGLVTSARLASAGTLDLLVRKRNVRRALYKEAALRAIALDQARRFDEGLERSLASWRGAAAMLGAVDSVASSGLDAYTQLRIISDTRQAAEHFGRTGNIAGKVASRVSRSGLGRAVNALGVLGVGVDLVQGVTDEKARNRLLGESAKDALLVLGLEDTRRLLQAHNADRAMIEGVADAIAEVKRMSRSRLERYKRSATRAFAGSAPALVGVVAGTLVSGGAGLVVREALALSEELAEHAHGVMGLSALTSLAFILQGPIEGLIHDGRYRDASSESYAVREMVGLHHRLSAEATATVYNMLWNDRWGGGISLGGFGRGFGLTVSEWITDDGRTEDNYKREVQWRIGRVRDGAAFGARLPETLRQLRTMYASPTDDIDDKELDSSPTVTRVFDGIEFVWIPPGEFRMGSTGRYADDDEKPVTRVRISRGYWLGKYEVTQGQWESVMGENPSRFHECGSSCPVENVSWEGVQDFIKKLNRRLGKNRYRLPTEAEWEYGARGDTVTENYGGNVTIPLGNDPIVKQIAWYIQNGEAQTHLVGRKAPNAFGLHDMLGNVWEWVGDWKGAYPGGAVTNPQGPKAGSERVLRGCSWNSSARSCRSAIRWEQPPGPKDWRNYGRVGFRLLREGE